MELSKPITPKQHGRVDYGFAAGLLLIPRLLKVNRRAQVFYDAMIANVVAVNGSTDHGVGFNSLLSVRTHHKIDVANLAVLYGMFATKMIRRDKKALSFHAGLTALATLNVLLSDYDPGSP